MSSDTEIEMVVINCAISQPVRHETTLREGLPYGRTQWRTTGNNKGARSRSETAEYLCDKNR